jgi:phosphonate transport system permease protein
MSALQAAAAPPLHDPQLRGRLTGVVLALLLLWPLLHLADFHPARLFEPGNLQVMRNFLAGFLPPAGSPEFLGLLLRATLETLALATAGTAMAMVIALPLGIGAAAPFPSRASARGRRPGVGRCCGGCCAP